MRVVSPQDLPPPLTDAARARIAALALRQRAAGGLLMKAVNLVGTHVEDGLKLLPKGSRAQVEQAASRALTRAYGLAHRSKGSGRMPLKGDGLHRYFSAFSGALGGMGGLPTALAELPFATTLIFRAVQGVAEAHGEDVASDETRIEVLRVFGAGGPGGHDDGIDTAFLGARLALTGPAVHKLIAKIAPKFAAVLTQKLATQTVPVLGALAGAGTNFAFVGYYTEVAHVHFGLRQLARVHGEAQVVEEFHKRLADKRVPSQTG